MADDRHFENRKCTITRARIVRSSTNFVCRRRNKRYFDFLTKYEKILKFKKADSRHFENQE